MHRRRWVTALALLPCFLLLCAPACETEEERVRDVVAGLARELPLQAGETAAERKRRIESNVAPWLDDEFALAAPWIDGGNDRAFAIVAATEIERLFPLHALDPGEPQVQLSPSGKRAQVTGQARASASQVADLHGFAVGYAVDLRREGKAWRVMRLELRDPRQDLPEARP